MPGLGTSFGRGGATTAQQDLANADCILIEGSSMAEAHPVGFRWVVKAKERGATIIHVDPRFSRTSALADIWVPIRAGGDLAFLGGLIHHVIENDLFFREYVVHYTNAPVLLRDDFQGTEEPGPDGVPAGLFSGWNPEANAYDPATWRYQGDDIGRPRKDPSLQHPLCVFQVLRRHFSRYTPQMVERVAGVPPELFRKVADALTAASGPERTAAICYAVGWTQHSKGVQIIRAASILQMLLGNIGRPGGGILALRGHASIQGSTDIPTLFDILPGYLPMPRAGRAGAGPSHATLAGWLGEHRRETGAWCDLPAYAVSLLKAYYGARATPESDWGWQWLPRVTRDHSHFSYWTEMADGEVEGLFIMGQNPSVGGQNARLERRALAKLDWLVVRDMVEIEPAVFWRADSPEVRRGELATEEIPTEVFLMPAAGHAEKEGSFTQTQRMLQWREKAVDPPGDARSEAWFVHQLALRLKARALASDDPEDEPLRALDWWYPEDAHGEPVIEAVLAEINGWRTDPGAGENSGALHRLGRDGCPHHGAQVEGYAELAADGSTACGCWIYSGVYGPDGINRANRREPAGPYGHGWGYTWPSDRRILYNRASAAPDGRPWSERKKLVWWDPATSHWTGHDVPDFPADKPPDYRPPQGAIGMDAHPGDAPFILHQDGLGWIFAPEGLKDGPLPAHFEPLESPILNPLYGRQTNPPARWFLRPDNAYAPAGDPRFPYVLTTYRLTEHHTAGGMSRTLSHLTELQPELFAEISPEMADEIGVVNGAWITVATLRSAVEARALVTRRIRPISLGDRIVHQVAMPFHWGSSGPNTGDVVNDLIPISGEPNVTIHESKALVCTVLPGRRPADEKFAAWFQRMFPPARGPGDLGGHGLEGTH
ncbi:molybdopterin-dependent oxidoreductase [soil metagenome]